MNATCQSLPSQLIKVIDNFMGDYQEFREDAAEVFVDTIMPGKPASEEALNDLVDQAIILQLRLLTAYGMVVGKREDKISARHLVIPSKKIIGTCSIQRTYIVLPSPFDKVAVTIEKTGGEAGVDIAICAKYSNGIDFIKKMKFIEKGKDTRGDVVQFVFTAMAEKVLTIHLVSTGDVSSICDFSLSIEGEFEQAAMQTISEARTQRSWSL